MAAKEAEELGLVTRICRDPLEEAFKLADEIASKSPHAIFSAKHLLERSWHMRPEEGLGLKESL